MRGQRVGYIRVSTVDQNPDRQLEGAEPPCSSYRCGGMNRRHDPSGGDHLTLAPCLGAGRVR